MRFCRLKRDGNDRLNHCGRPYLGSGPFVLAWGACMVAVLHIIREAWYRPDPYRHDITPILSAHEGRRVPVEDDREREGKEIA
jgi:hypothetical protein